jgi:molybdopterin/thiamine biosynthesis adenylyltransferase/rhodanese-related sulfurtransferase
MSALSTEQLRRYARHLSLPEVGIAGQERLASGSALIVGMGGLGSPAALYLAAAGVGRLGLVDFDVVDRSNLQRQILYTEADIGRSKLEAAAARLRAANPEIELDLRHCRVEIGNARALVAEYDVVIDGTDNFPTRYLVHDACYLASRPYVYGSIFRFEGQASVFARGRGPCYRCLFPEPPPPGSVPSCAEAGVLGVLPGIIGSIQANEALKLLLAAGEPLLGRLLLFDALGMRFRELALRRDALCPLCGDQPTQHELIAYDDECALPAADSGLDEDSTNEFEIGATEVAHMRAAGAQLTLLDVRLEHELRLAQLPEALWIPLHELPQRLAEVPRDRPVYAFCHFGMRSAAATTLLRSYGFAAARNLAGGIDAWSCEVDSSLPRY